MGGTSKQPFEIGIEIQPGDIDVLGHVNNVVFLRWVQDAAVAHWSALTNEQQKAEVVWVVARHEIDYKKPAMPGDPLRARTWVGGASRTVFERSAPRSQRRNAVDLLPIEVAPEARK